MYCASKYNIIVHYTYIDSHLIFFLLYSYIYFLIESFNIYIVSGDIPKEPVVSKLSGHVFEKSIIEKYLENNNNKCPVTSQSLNLSDLIAIKGK